MHTLHGVLAAATRLCVALALVLAPWANSMAARALAAPAAVATVTVGNTGAFNFLPKTQTITVGDTVEWIWTDGFGHSTTSGSCIGTTCTPDTTSDPHWDSGVSFQSGFTYTVPFTQTGTYNYYCSVHGPFSNMRGTIEVIGPITGLSAANSSPTPLGSATAFTATVSSGNPMTYTWSFGDTQAGSGALTSHAYGASGFYTAVVTASNAISTVVAFTPVTITTRIYLPLILR